MLDRNIMFGEHSLTLLEIQLLAFMIFDHIDRMITRHLWKSITISNWLH